MKKKKLTFRRVMNEAQLECIAEPAEKAGCTVTSTDCGSTVIVEGTEEQIAQYQKLYNAQFK